MLKIDVMERALVLAPFLLVGCSQEPAAPLTAPAEPTVLILQCDGEYAEEGGSLQQRRTYRIDLQAKTVDLWTSNNRWKDREGEDKLDITDDNINWYYGWTGEDKDNVTGTIMQSTTFNRAFGTVSSHRTILIPEGKVEDTFVGKCVKVDKPSNEGAF